jgi:hypothetical protein
MAAVARASSEKGVIDREHINVEIYLPIKK